MMTAGVCNHDATRQESRAVARNPRAMREHEASRRLVKSPPELWAECSDATSLSRHLDGSFGEIRITRLEPEVAVAWEGTFASGTVRLEPSGWGTRVILTARPAVEAGGEPVEEVVTVEAPAVAVEARTVAVEAPAVAVEAPVRAAEAPAEPQWREDPPRRRFIDRLRDLFLGPRPQPIVLSHAAAAERVPAAEPAPAPAAEPAPAPAPPSALEPMTPADPPVDADAALIAALDSLGQAHHRPFSRA
jgi:hypothetical protein